MQRAAISAVIAALASSAVACRTHATRVLDEGARSSARTFIGRDLGHDAPLRCTLAR